MTITEYARQRFLALADNPLRQMELRRLIRGRAFPYAILALVVTGAYNTATSYASSRHFSTVPFYRPDDWFDLPAAVYLLPVFAAVAAATLANRDHAPGHLDFLRLVDLSVYEIIFGRFWAVLTPMLLLLVAALPFAVARLLIPPAPALLDMLAQLIALAGLTAIGTASGLNAGTANREFITALVVAVIVTSCICPFSYLLALLITLPTHIYQFGNTSGPAFHYGAAIGACLITWAFIINAHTRLNLLFRQAARDGR